MCLLCYANNSDNNINKMLNIISYSVQSWYVSYGKTTFGVSMKNARYYIGISIVFPHKHKSLLIIRAH